GEIVGLAPCEVGHTRMRTDEQRASTAKRMLHNCCLAVVKGAKRLATLEGIRLEETAAPDWLAAEIETDAVPDVGHELHLVLPDTEDGVEPMVRLHRTDLAAVAEITRCGF